MYEIYIDVLVCTNIFINYFILLAISRLYSFNLNRLRLIIGAILGGMFSLLILLPEINFYLNLIIKFLISLIIVLISFKIYSVYNLIKLVASFYVVNFVFAGAVIFIWYFLDSKNVFVRNNTVYFDISPLFFIISTLITYLVIRFLSFLTGQKDTEKSFCNLKIEQNNKTINLKAKIDTGNNLKDPFSNKPVIVAEYKFIKNIIPTELIKFFLKGETNFGYSDVTKIKNLKFRTIPFNTVLGSGVMPAFMPDKVKIIKKDKKEIVKDAFIAICKNKILNEGYNALVGVDLLN